ncbi:hypothetical protein OKW34_001620 [Paraburkholderia youngii]|uniref:hypothetical protein n=1 Tax=Paraburkholderia youngii TaxID=2782701 RepID=UPI003D22A1BD
MAQYRSVGGLFTLEPEQTVTWTTAVGGGLDGGVVVQAPNIIDDVIGSDVLVTVNQGVIATIESYVIHDITKARLASSRQR